ncbi:hypothetical protein OFS54_09730 [Escherichia coli]|nr:hypothetical protein [Escherichia coli]
MSLIQPVNVRQTSHGAAQRHSCTCMKTTPQSGQAWRGYECALWG